MKKNQAREIPKTYRTLLMLSIMIGLHDAQAQNILPVGGAGVIADQTLTTDKLPIAGTNWSAFGGNGNTFSNLVSPTATVANTGAVTLTFTHRYNFEKDATGNWDGGAVFVSVNGGAFAKVPTVSFTSNGYSGAALASVWSLGEDIFAGQSTDYAVPTLITSVADLGPLNATDTIAVQFRGGWDGNTFPASTNWEIGTVQIADTGGSILNANFEANGRSGFTASTTGTGSSPWTYLPPISRFEIDATNVTADRYAPLTPGSVIDLKGANIQVVTLTGTLVPNQVFTLFDLSGGTTLTGSLGSVSLPTGTWDTSNLTTNGTIKFLAEVIPACQLGVLNLAANGGNNPNTGATWKVGDKYRIAFHTNGTTVTTSNDPEYYNDFSTTEAWLVPALRGAYWRAMITVNLDPTTTQSLSPKREVKENTGTGNVTGGGAQGGAGEPVYVVDGTTCIARNNGDIWDTWSNPFQTSLTVANPLGNGNNQTRVTGVFYSPFLNQNGAQTVNANANHGKDIATGCNTDGSHINALGNTTDTAKDISRGNSNANSAGRVWNRFTDSTSTARSLYVISVPLTIVDTNETVKPTLNSIVDNRGGTDFTLGTGSVIYSVTFSEPIDAETLTTADFLNVGTSTVTIDRIRGTVDPKVFTVTVTPSTAGTLQLQTIAGAVIADPIGNALDTTLAITDDTIINVVIDTSAPTLTSITDSTSNGSIDAFLAITYTVTFNEPINASTVNVADFGNSGSAPITVNSVTTTGNPAEYRVRVTPSGAGDLTLEIIAGATISDAVGNPLETTNALLDDTTITVNPDPMPILTLIEDNQLGGPVFATQSFAYLVSFSQVINPSTISVSDFVDGGTSGASINSVVATSNPRIFAVHVTPGGVGTISLQIATGVFIGNVNGTEVDTSLPLSDDTVITVNADLSVTRGTVTINNTATWFGTTTTLSGTLNASGSSKLVVIVTGENGNTGDLTGNSNTVTYDGVPLTKVIDRNPIGGTPVDQIYNDIWYLDNPSTSTGAIVAGVNSRGCVTAFALSGTAPGVGQTAISAQASKSVVLSTSFANSFVIASHGMGGDGNTANVTAVNATLPLIERTATAQTSLWDGHVTGTALMSSPGTNTYAFTGGNLVGSHTIAVEFPSAALEGYSLWASVNGAAVNRGADHDNDGVANGIEFFMGGTTGNTTGFTALPPVVKEIDGAFSITWNKSSTYTGAYGTDYVVETSDSLSGTWNAEVADPTSGFTVTFPTATTVKFTFPGRPAYSGKKFARLKVTGP